MPSLELSRDARLQVWNLAQRYAVKGYPEAIQKLQRNLDFAINPDNLKCHRFFSAPRPAPSLRFLGFRWMLHNGYWFAYTSSEPPIIVAIIHGSANIAGQAAHLFKPTDNG